jgi:hypothetical protein
MKRILLVNVALIALLIATRELNAQPATVIKTNPAKVYMHYMPWFEGPANPDPGFDYTWGYHWKMSNRNPNNINATTGKRQIAAHFYPLIGPYASSDPDLIEYHLLLMKLAGIDGVLIDWYGSQGTNGDVGSLLTNSNALIDRTDDVGLGFGLIIEDRFWSSRTTASTNITYAKNNYFNKENYLRIGDGNDPLVGIFGPITLQTEADWTAILPSAGEDVAFLTLWYESNDAGVNSDGEYEWIYSDYLTGLGNFYSNRTTQLKANNKKLAAGIAYPGFKDFYAQGGGGQSYFTIEHNNGATLNATLDKYTQFSSTVDFLQLATFNDFGEGTMFEPTQEFGFKYLAKIQEFTGVPYDEQDLRNVYRLFVLRKRYQRNSTKMIALNTAFNHFVKLELEQAVSIMNDVDDLSVQEATSIPGFLQAENFMAKHGTVLTEPATDANTGFDVSWLDSGDSLEYKVSVSKTETYNLNFRVGSYKAGGKLLLKQGNKILATINVPVTDGWQNWTNVSSTADLTEGDQVFKLVVESGSVAVNYVQFVSTTPVAAEKGIESKVEYWPTKVDRYLNVQTDGSFHSIQVVDVLGRERHLDQDILNKRSVVLDLQGLESGMHFVKLRSQQTSKFFRIIKN